MVLCCSSDLVGRDAFGRWCDLENWRLLRRVGQESAARKVSDREFTSHRILLYHRDHGRACRRRIRGRRASADRSQLAASTGFGRLRTVEREGVIAA